MGIELDLNLDKKHPLYTAGECITGHLEMEVSPEDDARLFDLQLVLTGVIHKWPFSILNKRLPRMDLNLYVLRQTKRYGTYSFCENKEEPIILPSRKPRVKLPFSLQIPTTDLFSTVIGHHGYALYRLVLLAKWQGFEGGALFPNDIHILVQVPGIRPNYDGQFNARVQDVGSKGSSLYVMVDGRCGVPGDSLSFTVAFENGEKVPLGCLKYILQQNVVWNFPGREMMKDAKILKSTEGPYIAPGPGRKLKWSGEVVLPHVVPSGKSGDHYGSYIVQYWLTFYVSKRPALKNTVVVHIGTPGPGDQEDDVSLSFEYFSQLRRSLSATSLDALSCCSSSAGSCWSSSDAESSGGERGTPFHLETPPPPYAEIRDRPIQF